MRNALQHFAHSLFSNGLLSLIFLSAFSFPAKGALLSPELVHIPAGDYLSGSSKQEREQAYQLDEMAYGHSVTRTQRWYEAEYRRHTRTLPGFSIMKTPVTVCDYQKFIDATDYPAPSINEQQWNAQHLIHDYQSTQRFQWVDGQYPLIGNRCNHPVVLVSHLDATAYAGWLSGQTNQIWRLPDEFEWEKAARGVDGSRFPWGNQFDSSKLNSHDKGPFDTVPVASFEKGASPFGLLDAAGQVFEWTSTGDDRRRYIVKGGSWDDKGCGVCRPAARHYRPEKLKHILVGFRLVTETE